MEKPLNEAKMSTPSSSPLHNHLIELAQRLLDSLSKTHYTPPETTTPISVKATVQSLLLSAQNHGDNPTITQTQLRDSIKDFTLACAMLSSSRSSTHELLSWVPTHLSSAADSAFVDLSRAYSRNSIACGDSGSANEEEMLVLELMPEVLPVLKERMKESSIDKDTDGDEMSAASARVPVGYAILAAYQLRWFVTQVGCPHLGKLSALVIPCGLTALDHWSPEVKGQGMISFVHVAKNVNAAELGWYGDAILDACCQNIVSADDIWHHAVEMSVLLVTCLQGNNPRSSWFERILNEMLGHLERYPRSTVHRVVWLTFIEPLFHSLGLVLLAHFRRMFPLFFHWIHADDDETVLLVLKRVHTLIRLTWIRNTPYFERLIDELVILHKEASLKVARKEIRTDVFQILVLLQQSMGQQFEAAWDKHKSDPNLEALNVALRGNTRNGLAAREEHFHGNSLEQGSELLKV